MIARAVGLRSWGFFRSNVVLGYFHAADLIVMGIQWWWMMDDERVKGNIDMCFWRPWICRVVSLGCRCMQRIIEVLGASSIDISTVDVGISTTDVGWIQTSKLCTLCCTDESGCCLLRYRGLCGCWCCSVCCSFQEESSATLIDYAADSRPMLYWQVTQVVSKLKGCNHLYRVKID